MNLALLRVAEPQGINIIDDHNELQWLSVPFSVLCLKDFKEFGTGSTQEVEKVANTPNGEIMYIIGGIAYDHYYFTIMFC